MMRPSKHATNEKPRPRLLPFTLMEEFSCNIYPRPVNAQLVPNVIGLTSPARRIDALSPCCRDKPGGVQHQSSAEERNEKHTDNIPVNDDIRSPFHS